jgi:hypothetical protein
MSIDFYPVLYDAKHDIFCIPESARAALDENSMNVSNANGRDLLDTLNINSSFGVKPVEDFAALLAERRQTDLLARNGLVSAAVPSTVDPSPGRMTLIDCGRRPGYIENRLRDLTELVQKARTLGATHISWG